MKVRFLKDLNDAEKIAFEQSGLYKRIKGNWSYTDTSIDYYKAYFIHHIYDNSVAVFSGNEFYLCAYSYTEEKERFAYFNMPTLFFLSDAALQNTDISHDVFSVFFSFMKEAAYIKEICYYHEPHITAHYFGAQQYNTIQYNTIQYNTILGCNRSKPKRNRHSPEYA